MSRTLLNLIWLLLWVSVPALASDRIALVIANSNYGEHRVAAAEKGGASVVSHLEKRGFEVVKKSELGKDEMREAIAEFLRGAPTNSLAMVHFAGFGHAEKGSDKRAPRVFLQGAGTAKPGKDSRNRSVEFDRWFSEMVKRDVGASRVLVSLDFPDENPLLGDGVEPDAGIVAGLELPDRVEVSLGQPRVPAGEPDPRPWGRELRDGRVAGEVFVNEFGMVFVWCPAGSFKMGQTGYPDAGPVDVKITRGFWMGRFELTQREIMRSRGKLPNAHRSLLHANAPVTGVGDGRDVVKKLNEKFPPGTGWQYAVPSEAQWEYACRAGSTGRFCFGDSPTELHLYGNFADKALHELNPDYHYASLGGSDGAAETMVPVGSYRPNAWGIHDMHGNVTEVCLDHYMPSLPGGSDPLAVIDLKKNPRAKGRRVMRGGAWCSPDEYCQSGFRSLSFGGGGGEHAFEGLRVILTKIPK